MSPTPSPSAPTLARSHSGASRSHALAGLLPAWLFAASMALAAPATSPRVEFADRIDRGELEIRIDQRPALVLQHGPDVDLAHFFPVLSPSGKSMTVQQTEPYPHHRSFWFADTVKLSDGRTLSFYNAYYSGPSTNHPGPPFRERIRLANHEVVPAAEGQGRLRMELAWETDGGRTVVLRERRDLRVVPLEQGEYFLDVVFQLEPVAEAVTFASDWVHYAWPFIRMNTNFAVTSGGRLVNSEGGVGEQATNGKPARWVDVSNTLDGVTEGLAIFSHPSNPAPHGWLTRDYGVFGPRREDGRSGKPFQLSKGDVLRQRVGILVHRGDVRTGHVSERFAAYAADGL